jgi:hypothetical protein
MTSADSNPIGAELAKQRCARFIPDGVQVFFFAEGCRCRVFPRRRRRAQIAVDGNGGTSTRRHIPFIAL